MPRSSVITTRQLVRRELYSAYKTKKILALLLVLIASAGLAITMAVFSKEILAYALGSELGEAFSSEILPEATDATAWQQWTNNLVQMVALIIGVITAYDAQRAVHSPAGHLLLTRPLRRMSVLNAQLLANMAIFLATTAVGSGIMIASAYALFDEVDLVPLWGGLGVWVVCAIVMAVGGQFFGVVIKNRAGAIGAIVGMYFVFLTVGAIRIFAQYTPAGLYTLPTTIAGGAQVETSAIWWPVITGLGMVIALYALMARIFTTKDL
ncbi:MAG: hypothetical protein GX483_06795 [Actinomycetaceae bacterium]|nr:hypothetical protein [Actinomycetaceae bacterium]